MSPPPTASPESAEPSPSAGTARGGRGAGDGLGSAVFVLLFLLALGLIAWGIYLAAKGVTWSVLAGGAVSAVAVLSAFAVTRALAGVADALGGLNDQLDDALRPIRHNTDATVRSLKVVESNSAISERAKRVAYREKDRDAMRHAIEEDLLKADYAGARRLADEMEKSFGYVEEAERVREEVRNRMAGERERELSDARAGIDRLCKEEKWVDAFTLSDRVIRRFGADMDAKLLRTRIEERRQNKKVELVQQFHAAVERKDVDEAADLIRRLDPYLTPDEGQQLAEAAREVFKNRLLRLREQFATAMQQHDYSEAIRVGEIIKRDFPNSQLAKEVKNHEPRIREAAGVAMED